MPTPAESSAWDVFVIQHSHIDIGFTDRQEVIAQYHRQFINQAVTLALAPAQADRSPDCRFRFTCEGFWAVEQYLSACGPARRADFLQAVRQGDIEITAFYLHLTELLDQGHLRDTLTPSSTFARACGLPLTTAMMCDVNGLSWGMADALVDIGVQFLISNLNTHHGGFPAHGPLNAFQWEAPSGGHLLVWNGLPYHKANLLGLMGGWTPDADPGIPGMARKGDGGYVDVQGIEFAERALPPVLSHLEANGYPYRFLPLMGSGLYTDNSPPTDRHCDLFAQWNARHGDKIRLRSVTLGEFFTHLEGAKGDIPVYRGDWPDWWSDGVASAPLDTLLFRNAQRAKRLAERLDPDGRVMTARRREEVTRSLTLYAEHTFGYSDTRSPALLSRQVFRRKSKLAVTADELASMALDDVLRMRGAGDFTARRGYTYRVLNPFSEACQGVAQLSLDWWEATPFLESFTVLANGEALPHQLEQDARGWRVFVPVTLAAGGQLDVDLRPGGPAAPAFSRERTAYANPYYTLTWTDDGGIVSLVDRSSGREALDADAGYGLGAPLYQLFPDGDRSAAAGFNLSARTIPASEVHAGQCVGVAVVADGPVFTLLHLHYAVPGALTCSVQVRLCHTLPQIDLAVRVNKTHVTDPEGMYAAFPLAVDGGVWTLDKPGASVRPGVDQIPGTCCDYYCVQDGAVYVGDGLGTAVTTLDAPLVQIGGLRLWQYNTTLEPTGPLFSWLTNNRWETNFPVLCGGNFEFRYVLEAGAALADVRTALARCRRNAVPLVTIRTG